MHHCIDLLLNKYLLYIVLPDVQASLPEADRHDTSAIYRKLTLAQLQKEVPQLNWLEYLRAFLDADIDESEPVVSYAMPYFVEMGRIIQKTDRRLQTTIIVVIMIYANKCVAKLAEFKYLGQAVTDDDYIHVQQKSSQNPSKHNLNPFIAQNYIFRPISGHPHIYNLCLKHIGEGIYIPAESDSIPLASHYWTQLLGTCSCCDR
jgi:predicted metalloendopeptidase